MKTLILKNKCQTNATLLSNEFIDNYMIDANGEFVKVYLFLLRHLDDPCSSLTISTIADCLNNTENDILRAFRYWEGQGLLLLDKDDQGRITGLELLKTASFVHGKKSPHTLAEPDDAHSGSVPVPAQSTSSPSASAPRAFTAVTDGTGTGKSSVSRQSSTRTKAVALDSFKAQKELKSLFFIAEQYLGKTLSHTDMEAITYFYDTLHLSADVIEFLLESCVENGHKSIHYIQKVALAWADAGVETVAQAKEQSLNYNKNCYTILNAFGIKGRGPASSEVSYIKKWTEDYGFSLDIVQEACRRTISATHQPSFEYTDSILSRWKKEDVKHLKDILSLDEAYQKKKAVQKDTVRKTRPATKNLNNFERRSYDMDSLEEQLLNSN